MNSLYISLSFGRRKKIESCVGHVVGSRLKMRQSERDENKDILFLLYIIMKMPTIPTFLETNFIILHGISNNSEYTSFTTS